MLLLARIDSGRDALSLSDVNLDEIIIDVVARLQKLASKKNLNIKFDIQDKAGRPQVKGDPDLLSSLIFNLLENAVKYSPPGELIAVSLIWESEYSIIEISDRGPGIPEAQKETIFDRFSRVNPSGKTKGFGLGLAIAKKIATLHQSEILIYPNSASNRDQGSVFVLKMKNERL